ncbi:FkbM family methyltransferase [Actinokineospora pegani]|uniref:FkbM family methyltransferase n=1 Tax=Actinokineospora pegani TaxID=2654637 RepID=UPI0012EB0529|nr:FkbM family methyltransferase [Actinokineospora pegani]
MTAARADADAEVVLVVSAEALTADRDDLRHAVAAGRSRGLRVHVAVTDPATAVDPVTAIGADTVDLVGRTGPLAWESWARARAAAHGRPVAVLGLGQDPDGEGDLAVASAAVAAGVRANPVAAVLAARDGARARRALADARLRQPPWLRVADLAGADAFLRAVPGPWLVGPAERCGGRGTTRVDDRADLPAAVRAATGGTTRPFLVERLVDGPAYAVVGAFLGAAPRVLLVAEAEPPADGRGQALAYRAPAELPAATRALVEAAAVAAVDALGLRHGVFDVAVRLGAEGPAVGEVHPRLPPAWGAVLLGHAVPGLDPVALVLDDALGRDRAAPRQATRGAAVRFAVAQPGRVRGVRGWPAVACHPGVLAARLLLRPGAVAAARPGGTRVAAVLVGSASAASAASLAHRLVDALRVVTDPTDLTDRPDPARRVVPLRPPHPLEERPMDATLTAARPPATAPGTGGRLALLAGPDPAAVAAADAAVSAAAAAPDLVRVLAGGDLRGHRGAVVATPEPLSIGSSGPAAGPRGLGLLFPGLGEQHPDMAAGLYRDFPEFAATVDHCAEVLRPELGLDIRTALFTSAGARPGGELDLRALLGRGDDRAPVELDRTAVAQPALFTVEYALARLWERWGARPEVMLGYSLGEYVAACLAGVLSLEDSLLLVARRAKLFETLPAGAMLAVSLPEAELAPKLTGSLALSAVNGPEFCVVAGPVREVAELRAVLTGGGVVVRPVRSGHAFHTPLMAPIADQVTEIARGLRHSAPRVPYVSNVTGDLITDAEATDPGYWARHLVSPVRFADGLRVVAEDRVLLEAGPGQGLSSMVAAVRDGDPGGVVAAMRHSLDPRDDTAVLLTALGRLWLADADLDWASLPTEDLPADLPTENPPAPAGAASTDGGDTEAGLRELWARLLPTDDIPRTASFFDLGGNSLSASRLALRVQRRFGVELTLRQLYAHPTIAAQAALVEGRDADVEAVDAVTGRNLLTLPNGLVVSQQNEAETRHFYHDIFDNRGYASRGITISDGDTVVDVGGNIGLFTLFAHHEAEDVKVYAFEPAPPMFEHLSANAERYGVNAVLVNAGLSDADGTAELTFYPRSSGMSSFHPDTEEERNNLIAIIGNQGDDAGADLDELMDVRLEAVPFTATLRSLSSVIREHGITRIDLIKIDVQKAELAVVRGIDDEHWPLIRQVVLEVHDGADGRVELLGDLLRDKGFRVVAIQDELYRGTDIHNLYAIRD